MPKEGTMAEKTEAEFSDNDRIAYCECGFFWTVPTGMPWRDCENCDEAPIDLIASYKALAQQDQGWEARRFTDGTGLFGVYHPAGTWQVGCQTPDRAQAEAWAAALNEGRPIQQDQESSGEGRRVDTWPEQIWLGGDEGVAWRMWWDRPRDDMDHAAYVPVSELERVEGERDELRNSSKVSENAELKKLLEQEEATREGVEEALKEAERINDFDVRVALAEANGNTRAAQALYEELKAGVEGLANWAESEALEAAGDEVNAETIDAADYHAGKRDTLNRIEAKASALLHCQCEVFTPKDKAPCETCGGRQTVIQDVQHGSNVIPCPTCTTEKQGEAERPRKYADIEAEILADPDHRADIEREQAELRERLEGRRPKEKTMPAEPATKRERCLFCTRERATEADWEHPAMENDEPHAELDALCWDYEGGTDNCLGHMLEVGRPGSLEDALPYVDRLTSLQAGLKAEVERLRRIQMHEEGMRGQWEREAPLQDDQAWAAQQVAGASKEAADRLENLLRESEGEA